MPGGVVGRIQFEQPVSHVEVLRAHDGALEVLRHKSFSDKGIRAQRDLRRLVADLLEVLLGDLGLQHVVEEQVSQHRVLAGAQQHDQVVVHQTLAVRREPVPQDVGLDSLGQVVDGVDDVARPHLRQADLAGGQVAVHRDRDLRRRRGNQ